MNIIEAVKDRNLLKPYVNSRSLKTYANWLTFLKVLYGLETRDREHEVVRTCTGREHATFPQDEQGFTEALVLAGRRSGKSKMMALVGAYEAVFSGREKSLSPGEIPLVPILSPTRFQSRIIYSYLKAVFESTPILKGEVVETKPDRFLLKNGVEVAVVTGDPRTCRGFSVIAAIVDEIAFFGLSEESKVRSDTELIRALRPSLGTTGGRLLCVGSPYAAMGYSYTTWKRHFGNPEGRVLVWNAPSTLMNPTLPKSVVEAALEDDPVAARVEYCVEPGAFREDVEQFITRAIVENLVIPNRKELPPQANIIYSAFADVSGGRSDDAAIAIGHKVGQIVLVDHLKRFKAPHNPYEVVAQMVGILRRYKVTKCHGDAYAAEWTKTAFESHGVEYLNATKSVWKEGAQVKTKVKKPKNELYASLLPRLTSGQIELLDDEVLVSQLSSLQRRTRSGGRDTIDHPPGGHDDVANVVAGVADVAIQRTTTAGAIDFGHTNDRFANIVDKIERYANASYDNEYASTDPRLEYAHGFLQALDDEMRKPSWGDWITD